MEKPRPSDGRKPPPRGKRVNYERPFGQHVRSEIEARLLPLFDTAQQESYANTYANEVRFSQSTQDLSCHMLYRRKTNTDSAVRWAVVQFIWGRKRMLRNKRCADWLAANKGRLDGFPDGVIEFPPVAGAPREEKGP